MKQKQAVFQNQGHEELAYGELFQMAQMPAPMPIVRHLPDLIPRKIPREFIPEINVFAPNYDNTLFCVVIEQRYSISSEYYYRRYFWSPSMVLFATMMRGGRTGLLELLGNNDTLSPPEQQKITEILHYLEGGAMLAKIRARLKMRGNNLSNAQRKAALAPHVPFKHIERKRLARILSPARVKRVRYDGRAFNARVPSKCDPLIYDVQWKQLPYFDQDIIRIHPAIQGRCDCGFHKASFLKYEYHNVLAHCHHIELLRQTLENPTLGDDIEIWDSPHNRFRLYIPQILAPFSPLDYPARASSRLRSILRAGLHCFLVPQPYLRENFDDSHNYHLKNGFTWFRCELDAFLLSFPEIYNPHFLQLCQKNANDDLSAEYTARFFGDIRKRDILPLSAVHHYNAHKDCLEHLRDGKWFNVMHFARFRPTNQIGKLRPDQYLHAPLSHAHQLRDPYLNAADFDIFHGIEKAEYLINFLAPFQVASLPGDLRVFLHPYKMRKQN